MSAEIEGSVGVCAVGAIGEMDQGIRIEATRPHTKPCKPGVPEFDMRRRSRRPQLKRKRPGGRERRCPRRGHSSLEKGIVLKYLIWGKI